MLTKTYRVYETNSDGDEIPVYVDDLAGERVPLESGTTFTADLDTVKVWDRRGPTPVEVDTGRHHVVASDIDVKPGCLTSLINTGRAVDIDATPKTEKAAPVKKKARAK